MRCTFCAQDNAQGARVCVSCGKTLTKDARESISNTGGRPQPASLADGRYRLDRFLGEGGSKIVYLARDTRLERDVAVALIKTEGIDEDGLIRAHREARAMGRLGEHPNVVNIYDVGEDDGRLFIVSQYISGGSVAKLLKATPGHRLSVERALVIASQVCQALAHAHAHGIIHRDLKPANVWLGEDGTAKLGDFGLAISTEWTKVTIDGLMAGTASYLAPEQALGKAPDARADLYSLGAMLFEMLCGRPPFVGQDAISIISQHINTPPVAPSWHNPDIPKTLDALILGLLAKAPTERPESASVVQERLADIAAAPLAPAKEEPAEATSVGRLSLGGFVGRLDELSTLKSAIDASLGGKAAVIMVVGEPGIGKTRLVEEAGVYAQLRGMRFLVGRCYESEVPLLYGPFAEAIRDYVSTRSAEAVREELGQGVSDVARLVDEIQGSRSVAVAEREPDQDRIRLLESVSSFLLRASVSNPLMLFLDDLQWADRPSLMLLLHLARRLRGSRLLIVGTYRDVELDRRHPLSEALAELRRGRLYERVLLRGLNESEVRALIEALTQEQLGENELARLINRETEGNPFFVEEVISHLVETGRLCRQHGLWVGDIESITERGIPEGIRDVISRRLSRLSAECNRLLTEAAVLGPEFEFRVAARMSGSAEEVLVAPVEEALAARILVEARDTSVPRYAFAHALIRQTLYDELSLPRKQRLHLKAAQSIEAEHERNLTQHISALAMHYRMAGAAAKPEKAVEYSIRAGEAACSFFAYEEAASHWQAALVKMEEQALDGLGRADLLIRLGELVFRTSLDQPGGLEYVARALKIYQELGQTDLAAQAHCRLGALLSARGPTMDIAQALAHFRAAEPLLSREREGTSLGLLYVGLAASANRSMHIREALDASQRGVEVAERIRDDSTWANAAGQLSLDLLYTGRIAEGLTLCNQIWHKAEELDDATVGFIAANSGGYYCTSLGDPLEAQIWYKRELDKQRSKGALYSRSHLLQQLCTACIYAGDLTAGRHAVAEAPRALQGALIAFREGEWGMTDKLLAEALSAARRSGNEEVTVQLLSLLAQLRQAEGDSPGALQILTDAFAKLGDEPHLHYEMAVRPILAIVYADLDRPAEGVVELTRCTEIAAKGEDWRGLIGMVKLAYGVLEAKRADLQEVEPIFAESIQIFGRHHLPWHQAEAYHRYGQALLASSERSRAVEKFDAALELYQFHGAGARWAGRILADKLRARGVKSSPSIPDSREKEKSPPRATSSGGALFQREHDFWTVSYEDRVFRLKDVKGMAYIAYLLRHPGREFHALDLVSGVETVIDAQDSEAKQGKAQLSKMGPDQLADLGMHSGRPEDAGKMLDERAKASYKRRLGELHTELEEARALSDEVRVAKAEDEIDALTTELKRAVGLGGRDRRAASASERARLNATRAIKAAIERISEKHPSLASHLGATIRTGTFCSYHPDPRVPVSWQF